MAEKILVTEMFGPTIQGEGALIGQQTFFIRFAGCDYRCKMCIEGSQRVLMSDFSLKSIKDVQVGDLVMGLRQTQYTRKLEPTKVTALHHNGLKPVVTIHTQTNSLMCTADHKLYTRFGWYEASETHQAYVLPVGSTSSEWEEGWLAGVVAGDGSYSKSGSQGVRLDLDSKDTVIIDFACNIIKRLGIRVSRRTYIARSGSEIHKLYTSSRGEAEKLRNRLLLNDSLVDFSRGWVAGFFDAEGCKSTSSTAYTISQSQRVNTEKVKELQKHLAEASMEWVERDAKRGMIEFRLKSWVRLLTYCRPILQRKYPEYIGLQAIGTTQLSDTDTCNVQVPVYDLTTELGSYVAEGFIVHNCDSIHAVDPEIIHKTALKLTEEEIVSQLNDLRSWAESHINWVTFSGGNPVMWDLYRLIGLLKETEDWKVSVETQGSIWNGWLHRCDHITVSPKGPGMGENCDLQILEEFMHHLRNPIGHKEVCLKVVCFGEPDLEFACVISKLFPKVPLYLSVGNPFFADTIARDALAESLFELYDYMIVDVRKYPELVRARILPQLHVLLWGNKQGV